MLRSLVGSEMCIRDSYRSLALSSLFILLVVHHLWSFLRAFEMTFNVVLNGKRLKTGNILQTSNQPNALKCIQRCVFQQNCRSVNYKAADHVCYLLDKNVGTYIEEEFYEDEEWDYYSYANDDQEMVIASYPFLKENFNSS